VLHEYVHAIIGERAGGHAVVWVSHGPMFTALLDTLVAKWIGAKKVEVAA
jgi:hypothetical protein